MREEGRKGEIGSGSEVIQHGNGTSERLGGTRSQT